MRRNATLFVLISLLSGFGSTAMMLAAGVWIFDLTGSVGLAALTGVCIYAPTLAAPWLGVLVDRLPRRPMLIAVDVALGAALLTLLTVRSPGGVWLIFLVLLARGVSYVLLDAGESAILPAALPPALLGDVNGWRSSAQEGMKLVAPLAGAGLYAWRGAVPVILLSAAMPLLSAACYALLRVGRAAIPAAAGTTERERVPDAADSSPASGGVRAGLRLLFRERAVRVPVLVAAVAITLSGVTTAAVLARVVHDLHLPATYLGFLATAQGAGSIVSGLLVGRQLARVTSATVAAVGAVIFAAGCVAWCLPWWLSMIVGSVLVGVGLPWALIAAVTAVQTGTPDHLLGRVAAASNMLMFGPVALALPLGSALVEFGARLPLLGAAVLASATGLLARRAHPSPAASVVQAGTDRPVPEPSSSSTRR
jgi:MFS family permease